MQTINQTRFYLTKKGLEHIEREYKKLIEFRNAKTRDEVPAILHSEDINPEYLTFQEDISLLEVRIAEYENILKNTEIIAPPKKSEQGYVSIGATVTVDLGGEVDIFTIVGTLEADPLQKKISDESPLGQGLLGAKTGDMVKVKTSLVNHDCKILKIEYL